MCRSMPDVFMGGFTAEANFGAEILRIRAVDADAGLNARLSYFIVEEITTGTVDGMENFGSKLGLFHHPRSRTFALWKNLGIVSRRCSQAPCPSRTGAPHARCFGEISLREKNRS